MEVKPTTLEHIKLLFNSPDEVYQMTSPRGRALIINNDQFDDACNPDQANLDDRAGSEVDLTSLQQIFEALDFITIPHTDLSSQGILDCISKETKHSDHEKYGMFILVILSHGNEGVIYGSDSRKVSINDIARRLSVKSFSAMMDKPKLIIIQACAGGENDNTFYALQKNTREMEASALPTLSQVIKSTVSDIVIMQASYPGYVSFRDPRFGTFMIRAVIDVLRDYSCHDSITELVVRVRNNVLKMCEKSTDKRNIGAQTVHCSETLRKKLYFFPGILASEFVESTCTSARARSTADQPIALAEFPFSERRLAPKKAQAAVPSNQANPTPPTRAAATSSNLLQTPPLGRVIAVSSNQAAPPTLPQSASFPSPSSTVSAIAGLFDSAVALEVSASSQQTGSVPPPVSASSINLSPPPRPPRAATTCSTLSQDPPSAQATVSCSPPPVSGPSAASSSNGSVKLTSLVKLRHLETISTPDYCETVTLGPDSQVIHGGIDYDSLNGTRDGLSINCIRAAQDNQLIMLEKGYITDTTHIVTYQLNQEPALMQKLFSLTPNTAYRETNKIQVQYNACITQFTKIDDLLIQTGGDSGKLYFYRYPTGGLIREVTHPDMKRPRGICHDANSDIYVTDPVSNSIFNVTLNNDGSPTVTKLSCEIVRPTGITSRDGLLAVLSTVQPVPELHIITTRGETVTVIELPKCRCSNVLDFSINTRGVVAIANVGNGVQLYELE